MNDIIEIDLQKMIGILLPKRFWIIGISLIVAVGVFLYFYLQPTMFQATAVVAMMEPLYQTDPDSEYQIAQPNQIGYDWRSVELLDVRSSQSQIKKRAATNTAAPKNATME